MLAVIHKIKEKALQISQIKTVSINVAVGHLILYPNKTYEFKTSGSLNLNNSRLRGGSSDIFQQYETVKSMGKKTFE